MNIKRAIGIALLTYIATFIVGILAAIVIGIDLTVETTPPPEMIYVAAFAAVVIAGIFSVWYFKGKSVEVNAKQGLFFGGVMIIIGFIMDIVTFIPYVASGGSYDDILKYYSDPVFWVTLILVLVTPAAVGHILQKK